MNVLSIAGSTSFNQLLLDKYLIKYIKTGPCEKSSSCGILSRVLFEAQGEHCQLSNSSYLTETHVASVQVFVYLDSYTLPLCWPLLMVSMEQQAKW